MKYLKYIFVYLFAFYFLLAGGGYNVVNYCCQLCADEGIEAVAKDSCFNVHHHTHNNHNPQQQDVTCSDSNHHSENCHLLRLNTDIPSFHARLLLKYYQIHPVDLYIPDFISYSGNTELTEENDLPPPENNVSKSGRVMLAFHAVLLI